MPNKVKSGIMGLCIGDALGVPVEFEGREILQRNPVENMRGYGTHHQPLGTWSDDTSMTLCLVDSLTNGLNYEDIMKKFLSWLNDGEYTPHGKAFDKGIATQQALRRFMGGEEPLTCGGLEEYDNGNGSLMRILPLAFYLHTKYDSVIENDEAMEVIHQVSSLTHAHKRSLIACGIYISIATLLLDNMPLAQAMKQGTGQAMAYYKKHADFAEELLHYERLNNMESFAKIPMEEINSSGYVVHTLEAAIWCLLTTDSYKDCVLKAVNLGEDTDTTAAVAGGLAGLYYGYENIPNEWIDTIVKRNVIEGLCNRFCESIATRYDREA